MKKRIILIFACLSLVYCQISIAQQFLNGDFETNTSIPCHFNMPNAAWDTLMADSYAYGLGNELDIINSSCSYGPAQSGSWYAALASPAGHTDAFTMTLDVPLVAGTSYTMQFFDKGDATYSPGIPIVIGVSTVPNDSGSIVYTGPVPTIGVWSVRNFTFTAPNNGQYISVSTTGVLRWTFVDNFQMLPTSITNIIATGSISVLSYCACSTLNVPFGSVGVFYPGNIYSAQLSDSSGNFAAPVTIGTLASTSNSGTISSTIPCNAVTGTLYRIRVVSNNPGVTGTDNGVNITIIATPPTPTITQVGAVLTSSSPTGNQWYLNGVLIPGATNQVDTATLTGIYTVIVSNESCSSSTSAGTFVLITEITEALNSSIITIFPNPFTSITTITFAEEQMLRQTQQPKTIKIMDVLGREIMNDKLLIINGRSTPLDLTGVAKGIYFVNITDEKKNVVNKKIVVQ